MKRKTVKFHPKWSLLLLLSICLLSVQSHAASSASPVKPASPVSPISPASAATTASVITTSSTGGVVNSPHDLGVGGPGSIKAKSERGVCIFCHTPHGGTPKTPLWNHHTTSAKYIPYSSSTMIAKVGQPNGASALCLSCHDGTVALGMLANGRGANVISMQHSLTVMPSGASNLGTNLSQDHPISFTYNSALAANQGKLCDPSALTGQVRLDRNSQVQCTSCHDPHNDQFGNFLVMNNAGSALCTTCHTDPLWASASHHLSTLPLKGTVATLLAPSGAKTAATTVGANACVNCHTPHAATGRQHLLRNASESQTCFTCHNGSVAGQNIEAEFKKLSVHPLLQTSQLSNPRRSMVSAPGKVVCSDCHNPHGAKNSAAPAPGASGSILGVKGVTSSGTEATKIRFEYELCFRCHGENAAHSPATVSRLVTQTNLRMAFSTSNSSYHPVAGVGKNSRVPSLLSPYTAVSMIKCTDCHNNDQGPGASGAGPRGPHGSAYAPLLERQLITTDYLGESAANDALCYKCHNRNSILSDQSFRAFNSLGQPRGHSYHIVDQKTACTTCHDSHGVALSQHLINFNRSYVTPGSKGQIQYNSTGLFRGNCTLTCHGYDHEQAGYPALVIRPGAVLKPTRKSAAPAAAVKPTL